MPGIHVCAKNLMSNKMHRMTGPAHFLGCLAVRASGQHDEDPQPPGQPVSRKGTRIALFDCFAGGLGSDSEVPLHTGQQETTIETASHSGWPASSLSLPRFAFWGGRRHGPLPSHLIVRYDSCLSISLSERPIPPPPPFRTYDIRTDQRLPICFLLVLSSGSRPVRIRARKHMPATALASRSGILQNQPVLSCSGEAIEICRRPPREGRRAWCCESCVSSMGSSESVPSFRECLVCLPRAWPPSPVLYLLRVLAAAHACAELRHQAT